MQTRHLFPAFIAVDETPPLVIGNAPQLEAKIRLLCKFAPLVEVVTDLRPGENPGRHAGARYLAGVSCATAHDLIAGRPLVILDTCDATLNAALSATAKAAGVPVNVPDNTALSSAWLGAIVDRAPVLIAISTGGAAPVLGQRIRARIESMLPDGFGRLARYLHRRRPLLQHLTPARRRSIQHNLVDGPAADHVLADDIAGADRHLAAMMDGTGHEDGGRMRIVDIGVGDPGLLSLRGVEAIRNADLIIHDAGVYNAGGHGAGVPNAGVTPAILDLARREAGFVAVPPDQTVAAAASLAARLATAIAAGQQVVLLQGQNDRLTSRPIARLIRRLSEKLAPEGGSGDIIPAAMPPAAIPDDLVMGHPAGRHHGTRPGARPGARPQAGRP